MGTHIKNALIASAAVAALAIAAADTTLGWMVPLAGGGGLIIAAALVAVGSRTRHAGFSPDSFARGGVDILNISTVRVAGVGGLGLVLVAAGVALEFPLIRVAVTAGALGGLVAGAAMILTRRHAG